MPPEMLSQEQPYRLGWWERPALALPDPARDWANEKLARSTFLPDIPNLERGYVRLTGDVMGDEADEAIVQLLPKQVTGPLTVPASFTGRAFAA
jgi:hypothetical protein